MSPGLAAFQNKGSSDNNKFKKNLFRLSEGPVPHDPVVGELWSGVMTEIDSSSDIENKKAD